MKKLLVVLLFLALLPLSLFAQFSVEGTIKEAKSKETLAGANIKLLNTFNGCNSNKKGEYLISNLQKGNYILEVSFLGYETQQKKIYLSKNTVVNFVLEEKAILADEVIISATRASETTPTTFKNIDKSEIEKINLGQDIPFILKNTPSVIVTSDAGAGIGYTGIRIRGTDMTRINVTLNGIPLNDPESHGVWFVNMPDFASSIENMQIQRGVGTSTNGAAAFGASINIQTNSLRDKPYTEINNSFGSFNTLKNSISAGTGLIDDKWAFNTRLSKIYSDGFIDRAFSDLKSFFVSATYYGNNSMLKLNIFSGKEKTYQAWSGVPKSVLQTNRTYNPYTYENETDNYQQDHFQLIYSKKINKNFSLNSAIHYTHGEGYYEQFKDDESFTDYQLDTIFFGFDTVSMLFLDTIAKTDLIRQKWLRNDFYGFTWSLNYDNHKNVKAIIGGGGNKYVGDHFGKIIWTKYSNNLPKDYQWYSNTGVKTAFNIFAKINYQLLEKVNVFGDMQYRKIDYKINGIHDDLHDLTMEKDYNFFNPKLGVFCKLNKNQNIYFSFAVANREPNRGNFRDADLGEIPQSEQLLDYELGHSFNSTKFRLNSNIFYMDYKNQLVLTGEINNVGEAIMTNIPESYRQGIEISADAKFTKILSWSGNVTFSQNKILDFTSYVDDWDHWGHQISNDIGKTDISFSPNIIAGNQFSFEIIDKFFIRWNTKYVSDQYIDNTSSESRKLDAYVINDFQIEYSLSTEFIKEIVLTLMVNNAFNEEYETNAWVYRYYLNNKHHEMNGYFPQAGINFLAGVNLKF
ncbi:MAG: TonB-dependent receptor [Bacteroidota bacterium]|nr:TonB-dependent receptor [Bacteroidota bacterium]